jgi:phage shock protein C
MTQKNVPGSPKKLYRSRSDRKLAGVCGGIGEYFEIDPVLIRLLWIFFTLAGGGGVLAYIIAWLVVPESSRVEK